MLTKEQEQRLWEWCGIKYHPQRNIFGSNPHYIEGYWTDSKGKAILYPELDLNNLFKYAVPKLDRRRQPLRMWTQRNTNDFSVSLDPLEQEYITMEDPAQALALAILKIQEGKDGR